MKLDKYTSPIYKKIHLKQLQTSGFKRVSKKYDNNKKIRDHLTEFGWVNLKKFIPKNTIKKIHQDLDNLSKKVCRLKFEDAVLYLNKFDKDKLHRLSLDAAKTQNHMGLISVFNKKYSDIIKKKS
jgi:hypothetical protein